MKLNVSLSARNQIPGTLKEIKKIMADEAEKQKRTMMEKVVKTKKTKSTKRKVKLKCLLNTNSLQKIEACLELTRSFLGACRSLR